MLLNICSKTNKGQYQSEHEAQRWLCHYHTLAQTSTPTADDDDDKL